MMPTIVLSYRDEFACGVFLRGASVPDGVWIRLRNAARELDARANANSHRVELSWPSALSLLRVLSALQTQLGFEFDTDETSAERVEQFIRDYRVVRQVAGAVTERLTETQIQDRLRDFGWNLSSHMLKPYQLGNLQLLLSLSNGANFSVPGAGKTTVTFALHLLSRQRVEKVLVVAPRNAFPAWEAVIDECLTLSADESLREPFKVLSGGESKIGSALAVGGNRFIISYDQLVRVDGIVENYLSVNKVHLILDESHRMKAGSLSQRGATLLRMGHLAVRRDILSGTPMPQSSQDLQSQLDFLWPGAGLGSRIATGEVPRSVLGNLYVRTTKLQLGLPDRRREAVPVSLTEAHLAFYAVLREDVRAQASVLRTGNSAIALINARRSVVRLLQAAVNPELVVESIQQSTDQSKAGLLKAVLEEGPSARIRAAADLAQQLVTQGKKVLIWTIFTSTINQLKSLLAHMQPALIYGQIGVGDEADDDTRQGQIRRFKTDAACMVMIANPAAAAEGISLHMHCHDAIYVDRSYNATHYLQSIDRIHRLGLPPDVDTTIYVLQNKLPSGVGSIDLSVSRRLATKIRNMERLLADPDLHELALDEENSPLAIEDSIDARDIDDLVAELEGRAVPPSADDYFE
jgi:SNF2 family DNA or RNA helicase